ncbi:hypothetical protein ABT282_15990 [Streptomyces sp. NPDC000927]|uniref:hypothetical protein n=1 Tax=Streptomyces sp. NPDC000927 TaxID=3154371 RepID=UPI00333275FE
MASGRHFRVTQTPTETRQEIEADIANARHSQRELQAAGQHGHAENMRAAADEYLDELTDLNAGRWTPRHR